MTPEERARSLYWTDPDSGLTPQAERGIKIIAAAIREAENEARDRIAKELAFQAAQLRHAYTHLMAERVSRQKQFAEGLIAPAIEAIEQITNPESGTPAK